MTTAPAVAAQRQVERADVRHRSLGSRLTEYRRQRGLSPADPDTPRGGLGTIRSGSISRRPSYVHARYYDRPDLIRHDYRHIHTYYDYHNRLHHRVIWPRYHYPVYYRFGHRSIFRHVYPYYHRKHVFISLGGWWPDYPYVRYYWYGWHPYLWYGYYPIAYEVPGNSYNYYTYNYYQTDDGGYTSYTSTTPAEAPAQAVDQSTWADVRAKLDEQNAEPAPQSVADTRFEEGVQSFEAGNYNVAAQRFAEAMRLAPDDMILPFAYAQALFAEGQYTESAELLRKALSKASPEKEGVFYPRGLYSDDDVLFAQIEKLVEKQESFGYDADMQLLLGYHLLGVGETGYAREPLERASQDLKNVESAKVLLTLLEKIESEAQAAEKTDDAAQGDTAAQAESAPAPQTEATTGGAQLPSTPGTPARSAPDAQPQDKPEPSPQNGESGPAPIMQQDGTSSSGKSPGTPDSVGAALVPLPSDVLADISRYMRADFAIFAGIVMLVCAGLYVQWKLLGCDRI